MEKKIKIKLENRDPMGSTILQHKVRWNKKKLSQWRLFFFKKKIFYKKFFFQKKNFLLKEKFFY